jgi:hypothetical protein
MALAGYSAAAWHQVGYWQDSETLFTRTSQVTQGNYHAYQCLANVYAFAPDRSRLPEAIAAFE